MTVCRQSGFQAEALTCLNRQRPKFPAAMYLQNNPSLSPHPLSLNEHSDHEDFSHRVMALGYKGSRNCLIVSRFFISMIPWSLQIISTLKMYDLKKDQCSTDKIFLNTFYI